MIATKETGYYDDNSLYNAGRGHLIFCIVPVKIRSWGIIRWEVLNVSIGAIPTRDVSACKTVETRSDSSLEVQRLGRRMEKLVEQLQGIRDNNAGGESNLTGEEKLEKQIDEIDKRIRSLTRQGSASVSASAEASKISLSPVDVFIKNEGLSQINDAGIYRLEKDENGNSKIIFSKSEASASAVDGDTDAKQAAASKKEDHSDVAPADREEKSEKASDGSPSDKHGELVTVNTNKVDAEIRKLKKEKQQIEQELKQAAGDDAKHSNLEKRLRVIESELKIKDTDSYRRQNADYTKTTKR